MGLKRISAWLLLGLGTAGCGALVHGGGDLPDVAAESATETGPQDAMDEGTADVPDARAPRVDPGSEPVGAEPGIPDLGPEPQGSEPVGAEPVPAEAGPEPSIAEPGPDGSVIAEAGPEAATADAEAGAGIDATMDAPAEEAGPDVVEICTSTAETCARAGTCPTLLSGTSRTFAFDTATADQALSCGTAGAADVVAPLVLTAASDVVIAATPVGGDTAQLGLFNAASCAVPGAEVACAASDATNPARVRAYALPAGTYYVVVKSINRFPVSVLATVTPAATRQPGDVCPGTPIAATPTSIFRVFDVSSPTFQRGADHGTTCGSLAMGATPSQFIDVVFSYTLTETRDVTIDLGTTADGVRPVAVQVESVCGSPVPATTVVPCQSAYTPYTQLIRSQPAGTYYIVAEFAPSTATTNRTVSVRVRTAAPTNVDACPGLPLAEGVTTSVNVAELTSNYTLSCLSAATDNRDGVFWFNAPAPGREAVVTVSNTAGRSSALQLQRICGDAVTNTGACVGPATGPNNTATVTVAQRYPDLTPGQAYSVIAGTRATTGSLQVNYVTIPSPGEFTLTPGQNNTCGSGGVNAIGIAAQGGVYHVDSSMMTASSVASDRCLQPDAPRQLGCQSWRGRDAIFRLDLTQRRRISARVTSARTVDFAMYIRPNTTAGCPGANSYYPAASASVACNDDSGTTDPYIDTTLAAGTYWLVVDTCVQTGQIFDPSTGGGVFTLEVLVLPPL